MKKKILIFPYSNQLGTTIPSITLANMLEKEGYEVEFASNGKFTFIIKKKGFTIHDIPEISYMHYREYLDKNSMDYYSQHVVRLLVDYESSLIEKLQPDIVVGHNRPSLYISSKLTDVKYINLTVASLTEYYNQKIYIPENHFLNKVIPLIDSNKIVPSKLRFLVYKNSMKSFAKGFNQNLKYFQLPQVKDYLELNEADIVLLTETYGLVKVKNLPNNYYYLEQDTNSCFGRRHTWLAEIESKKKGKKVIYISMGSSSFESYPIVLRGLVDFVVQNRDKYILVSNHCGLEKEYVNTENIYIEKYIQPKSMLNIADVVITHGGKNTLNEVIMAKKPVIGIPEQAEQLWNLKYAESLGVAKVLSRFKLKFDSKVLVKSVVELLGDNKYIRNLDRVVEETLVNRDHIDHDRSILNAIRLLS